MPIQLFPSAEPFFFPGGRACCLLVHGFTGTPEEMLPLGEFLASAGIPGVRLAVQATTPQYLEMIPAARVCTGQQRLWCERSGHVLPSEPDHEILFHAMLEFIQSVTRITQ